MEFKLADIFTDANILKEVAEAVDLILKEDPLLERAENRLLGKRLEEFIIL